MGFFLETHNGDLPIFMEDISMIIKRDLVQKGFQCGTQNPEVRMRRKLKGEDSPNKDIY